MMSKKKTFALRIDESVYSSVEQWAADEFRSVNGQLEWMIREQLKKAGRLRKSESIQDRKKDLDSPGSENEPNDFQNK